MSGTSSGLGGTVPVAPAGLRARLVRTLLPAPRSPGHGLSVLLFGFGVEGATEVYQFLARGDLVQGPVEYYSTLATTILGFYLMFLGLREWHTFHPKPGRAVAVPPKRRWPWIGFTLWVVGTALTAALSVALGGGGAGAAPWWIVWPVGGLVVLAFGSFFLDLRREAQPHSPAWGAAAGWTAFVWSVGVATVAGLVVGERAVSLLTEFVTSWSALIASIGPIVVAMSPLFVTYALMAAAFVPALRRAQSGPASS